MQRLICILGAVLFTPLQQAFLCRALENFVPVSYQFQMAALHDLYVNLELYFWQLLFAKNTKVSLQVDNELALVQHQSKKDEKVWQISSSS